MEIVETVFGQKYEFSLATEHVDIAGPLSGTVTMVPATRDFQPFDDAADEYAISRRFLGIHFRDVSEAGTHAGQDAGSLIVTPLGVTLSEHGRDRHSDITRHGQGPDVR